MSGLRRAGDNEEIKLSERSSCASAVMPTKALGPIAVRELNVSNLKSIRMA